MKLQILQANINPYSFPFSTITSSTIWPFIRVLSKSNFATPGSLTPHTHSAIFFKYFWPFGSPHLIPAKFHSPIRPNFIRPFGQNSFSHSAKFHSPIWPRSASTFAPDVQSGHAPVCPTVVSQDFPHIASVPYRCGPFVSDLAGRAISPPPGSLAPHTSFRQISPVFLAIRLPHSPFRQIFQVFLAI